MHCKGKAQYSKPVLIIKIQKPSFSDILIKSNSKKLNNILRKTPANPFYSKVAGLELQLYFKEKYSLAFVFLCMSGSFSGQLFIP